MTPKAVERPQSFSRRGDWTILEAGDGEAGISLALGLGRNWSFAICSCRK